jgi:DNA-binding transcriptional LysR family regulator
VAAVLGAACLRDGRAEMRVDDMLNWNDLRYFLAVARGGSMSAAAKSLKVNQSTIQRRLSALEQTLECGLLERETAGYQLTPAGKQLLPYAKKVEAQVMAFQRAAASLDRQIAGELRVTCFVTIGHRIMKSGMLERFEAAHPGLAVELIMGQRALDLAAGEADIAIRGGGPGGGALIGRKIADLPWAIFASRDFVAKHGKPPDPVSIQSFPIIDLIDEIEDLPAARWLRHYGQHAKVVARCGNVPSAHLAAKSGAGLAALPAIHARGDDDLVCVLGPFAELNYPIYLYAHRAMRKVPRVDTFFRFCLRELKPILVG